MNSRILKNVLLMFLFLFKISLTCDCVFKNGNITNCLNYCMTYFSLAPQRMYYNQTSCMCQPMVQCQTPIVHVYDYNTNQCYTDKTLKTIAPSLIPATFTIKQSLQNYDTFICVNGYQVAVLTQSFCVCKLLWQNSGKYDMDGNEYQCDQVVSNIAGYFLQNLVFDSHGNIIYYGQFTPTQIKVIIQQLKSQQASQTSQFALNQASSILYLIQKTLKTQPIIRSHQIPIAILFFVVILIIYGVSYFKFQSSIIKVTKQEYINQIMQIASQQSPFICES